MQARRILYTSILFSAFFLAACTMDVATVVNQDGSGATSIRLSEKTENTEFLRKMPNMADYLDVWQDSLRAKGVLIDVSRRGGAEHLFLQRRFEDIAEISTPGELPDDIQTWISVSKESTSLETRYRYTAVIDTTALYQQAPGIDSRAQNEVEKRLNEVQFTYSVTLPGNVTYSNASRQEANRLIWNIRMNARNEIVAESRLRHERRETLVKTATAGLASGIFVSVLLFLYSLFVRYTRT